MRTHTYHYSFEQIREHLALMKPWDRYSFDFWFVRLLHHTMSTFLVSLKGIGIIKLGEYLFLGLR